MSDADHFRTMFQGGAEGDIRFQFEIIKQLAETGRTMAASLGKMQETQVSMLERLARIEANTVGAEVKELKGKLDSVGTRVDALERDKDVRDGAVGALNALRIWGPVVFSLICAMYLLGRAMGIIPSPPTTITKIDAPLQVEGRAK